jgi:CheY-like chemotaxis protein
VALVSEGRVAPPVLARRLHGLGAEVSLADSAAGLADEPPDVVIVDAAAGRAADRLAEVRARFPGGFRAVVALRPLDRAVLPDLRAAGFDGHLIEPIRTSSLVHTVLGPGTPAALTGTVVEAPRRLDVLLVDDNEINALLGRTLLEHAGHRVRVAADGRSALAAAAAARDGGRPFDVVLMDLHMPDFDGFAAIEALVAGRGGDRAPRIVAVTADATAVAAERAIACGADSVLTKPIDRRRLGRLLEQIGASGSPAATAGAA